MTVTIEWDNDQKTVLLYQFRGAWTWEELRRAVDEGYARLDAVGYVVDAILDFSESDNFPPNPLAHAREYTSTQHPLAGVTIFVGANALFRSLWAMFNRVYGLILRQKEEVFLFADDLDEARDLLKNKTPGG
jgi:hypothetical protein